MKVRKLKRTACLTILAASLLHTTAVFAENTTATIDATKFTERLFAPHFLPLPYKQDLVFPEQISKEMMVSVPFTLRGIEVQGNTVFSTNELIAPVQSSVGRRVAKADVDAIVMAIRDKYRKAGYELADVRASVTNDTLVLMVSEGYIDNVTVKGDIPASTAATIQRFAERVANGKPVQLKYLIRSILLINDLPGIRAKAILSPSASKPGSNNLTIEVTKKPVYGYLSYDNRGSRIYGPQEFSMSGYLNSWWGANQTGVRGAVTQESHELRYAQLSHLQYLGNDGLNLFVYANEVATNPGGIYETDDFEGYDKAAGATLSYPIYRSREHSLYVYGTVDALNKWVIERSTDTMSANDRIRSVRAGTNYNFTDWWKAKGLINLEVSQGLNGFGANKTVPSNEGGEVDYTKIRGGIFRTQYLINDFSLYTAVRGQYTRDTLLVPEQMGFGGGIFGRGYDPAELLGDKSAQGKVELRYEMYPHYKLLDYAQLFAFYDAGLVWNYNDDYQDERASGTSTGVGTRFTICEHLSGILEVDFPLTRTVFLEDSKKPRGYFTITANL